MDYIGVVKDNYLFTNSKLSKGDIVYHYNKLGKMWPLCTQSDTLMRDKIFNEMVEKDVNYRPYHINGKFYQGTGRITSKYRVVEVYETSFVDGTWYYTKGNIIKGIVPMLTIKGFGYKGQRFEVKLEKIKDVDLELSDFVSWNKVNNHVKWYNKNYETNNSVEGFIRSYNQPIVMNYINRFKLTKYTGLTRCIRIGDE